MYLSWTNDDSCWEMPPLDLPGDEIGCFLLLATPAMVSLPSSLMSLMQLPLNIAQFSPMKGLKHTGVDCQIHPKSQAPKQCWSLGCLILCVKAACVMNTRGKDWLCPVFESCSGLRNSITSRLAMENMKECWGSLFAKGYVPVSKFLMNFSLSFEKMEEDLKAFILSYWR